MKQGFMIKMVKKKQAGSTKAPAKKKASSEVSGFASARVERLIRGAGAFRVSADAIAGLNTVLTDFGTKIAKYAVEICNNSGRKTVKSEDIKLAASKL
jgi:histone H3/H4